MVFPFMKPYLVEFHGFQIMLLILILVQQSDQKVCWFVIRGSHRGVPSRALPLGMASSPSSSLTSPATRHGELAFQLPHEPCHLAWRARLPALTVRLCQTLGVFQVSLETFVERVKYREGGRRQRETGGERW